MYMAYGWPQVIPLEPGLCPASEQIVYLKVINRLLLAVAPSHIELWSSSQHKVRLGKYKRDSDSIQREGENLQAVWSPNTKMIAIVYLARIGFFLEALLERDWELLDRVCVMIVWSLLEALLERS
ncbi:hypothetical protein HHK36_000171 [Tetracentron sinense]|uniref:Uncharacterized protein n=1 Tax=Tetracentron sinense TaxID=13715 RepID=A0A834ZRS1_TETSI|nr:hypothetical protein HHK36_000171 [Tetracentron sinense]